jgi:steroid delta-isomerase-like uncharacterized protein
MAIEDKERLVKQFYDELYVQHNLAVVYDCLSDNYVCHVDMGSGHEKIDRDLENLRNTVAMFYAAFPDEKITIDDIKTEGYRIVTRWTMRGTQYGDFMGIAPTHKQVSISGTCIDSVEGDKIVESWVKYDLSDLLRQLGVSELELKKAA